MLLDCLDSESDSLIKAADLALATSSLASASERMILASVSAVIVASSL